MSITVNVHDAKTRFSQLLEQAHSGQEIILAKAAEKSPEELARELAENADAALSVKGR